MHGMGTSSGFPELHIYPSEMSGETRWRCQDGLMSGVGQVGTGGPGGQDSPSYPKKKYQLEDQVHRLIFQSIEFVYL